MITEVMYHPVEDDGTPDGDEEIEFIELYNSKATREDISGFSFTNGIRYTFPAGTILSAREYLVVARDAPAVEATYGITGVYEWTSGRLNNNGERIELSNGNGEIVISFRYNDGAPWPASADGTGHSLVRVRAAGDPEEASTWGPSAFIGGTPGSPDEAQLEPDQQVEVTLVDVGHPGRYFKGIREPSIGIDWTEIAFNDNPATTDWIDGDNGYGYSNEFGELQWIETELDDMAGDYISVFARLPFNLTPAQISSFSQLSAEVHYDDGYVLYLNGTKVAGPINLIGNPPPFDRTAANSGDYPADNVDLTGFMHLLVSGTNVLSIQVHNVEIDSSDLVAGPILRATEEAVDTDAHLVINELLTNSDAGAGVDWLEVYNPGPIAVDLSNVYLSEGRFELLLYKLPAEGVVLQPGDFFAVSQGAEPTGFPFGLAFAGETVFLTEAAPGISPQPLRVLDAVRFGVVEADVTLGRYPDGADNFQALSAPTRGSRNAQQLVRDIVINEIMYHHGSRDERYEYVELHNTSGGTISLEGWSFTDGISYDFNDSSQVTDIPAGGYLVVAKDPDMLEATYASLTIGLNLVGPYRGHLDHHTERLRISFPLVEGPNTYMVAADEVTYYDGGQWPTWADGEGASMELRDPRSNNNLPGAWADSDETGKAAWEQFSHQIAGSDSRYTRGSVSTFGLLMLNRGEILFDNLEVVLSGSNKLSNNGFESGASSWRMLGNHVRTFASTEDSRFGSRCLHVISTGHGDPGANRVNQSISGSTTGGVTFRGWARWLRGTRHVLLRTTQNQLPVQPPRPAYSFELTMPMNLGTPGEQNTAHVSNRGPSISDVAHAPVLPAAYDPIVVTARITDNDGVGTVVLHYRSEGSAGFASLSMADNGAGNDLIAQDNIYTATIPGTSSGRMRAFYITASDGSVSTRFPTMLQPTAEVPERTCLVRIGDTAVTSEFAVYHAWMSNEVVGTFNSRPNLSNELLDCTFVYNDTDIFYNAHIRLRGSPFLRNGFGEEPWPGSRRGIRIEFNPDQKFATREEINLDGTEGGSRGPLQERASFWFYRYMGLQYSTQEYVRPVVNGNTARNYEDVQKIDGDYVDAWWPENNEGYIHKIDDYFEYGSSGQGFRNFDEGLKYDASHPLLKETYRWGFEKRSHREDDNWDHIFDFAVAMNTPVTDPGYEAAIESVIYPYHFAAVLAIRHAVGDWDSYGYERGKNNFFYYALPERRWYLLPWDIDFTLGSGNGPSADLFRVTSNEFPEVLQFLRHPKYEPMYLGAFSALVHGPWQTSYGTSDPPTPFDEFLDDAANALSRDGGDWSRRNSIKGFVRDRRSYILSNYNIPVLKFEISGRIRHIYTSNPTVMIRGVAPFHVRGVSANGVSMPTVFLENSVFETTIPIDLGLTDLFLQALDSAGNPLTGLAPASITVTRIPPATVTSTTPSTVCNNGTTEITVSGTNFEPGSATEVALVKPSDEIGFDALYVQDNEAFGQIDAATLLLDFPDDGISDPVYAVHPSINLWNGGSHGLFSANETSFAPPFNTDGTNYAVRFTGYIYTARTGIRYFGVNSDEGFRLSIAGQLVGEYADIRTAATSDINGNITNGTMLFSFPAPGRYYLELDYFENNGGEEIEFFETDMNGDNRKLINVDSDLIVYRNDTKRVEASDVVIADAGTIICLADLIDAEAGTWNAIVTPEAGQAWSADLDGAVEVLSCRANVNHDSEVNFLDLAKLADNWQQQCSMPYWCFGTDIDHSGRIDLKDVAFIADEWLLPR